jgi:hypothetical protein
MNASQIRALIPPSRWSLIRQQWLSNLPTIYPSGTAPIDDLEDFQPLRSTVNVMTGGVLNFQTIVGVKEIVLHEAIYLLHKASHVLGCAEADAVMGAKTWSVVQAYQAAYFSGKALLRFFGIATHDSPSSRKDVTTVINVWPSGSYIQNLLGSTNRLLACHKLSYQYGHIHMWHLLQYVLSSISVDTHIWEPTYVDVLTNNMADHEFAKQRNDFNYGSCTWLFDDLFEFKSDNSFGIIANRLATTRFTYSHQSDFTLIIAIILFHMGFTLLESIAEVTNALNGEIALLKSRINALYHPIYIQCYP